MRPCLCDRQQGPPFVRGRDCHLCYLYHQDGRYRALWDATPGISSIPGNRGAPPRGECLHLGKVLDRLGCNCPRKWQRACELHGTTTLVNCGTCRDHQPDG